MNGTDGIAKMRVGWMGGGSKNHKDQKKLPKLMYIMLMLGGIKNCDIIIIVLYTILYKNLYEESKLRKSRLIVKQ